VVHPALNLEEAAGRATAQDGSQRPSSGDSVPFGGSWSLIGFAGVYRLSDGT